MSLNRVIGRSSVVFVGVFAALGMIACPPGSFEECENAVCDVVAPGDGGGADADGSAPTDPCLTKPDDPACVTDERALFVSSAAADANGDGTKAKPFKSLGVALGKISAEKKRIYVCGDAYPEDVVLEAKHSGVSIFGGMSCAWAANPAAKPRFGSGTLALKIAGATGVAIANVAFVAKDATTAGGSSIGALVADAEVTFKSVSLEAGKGMAGEDGKLVPFEFPAASALKGKNGDAPDNGAATSVTCPGDTGTSTTGGAGSENGFDAQAGTPGMPNGGKLGACNGPGTGGDGEPKTAPPAAAASTLRGELTVNGWAPQAGADGAKGAVGQGGGGGLGAAGGRGGGGGAGGCGGAGGGGGRGGGSSIALATVQSTVRVATSTLRASVAGSGGKGVDGQSGQTGGERGLFSSTGTSCTGGKGGAGTKGSEGAGGAGGSSIGVLYKGAKPELDAPATIISVQSLGAGGTGGKPGPGGNDGPAGVAEEIQDATNL